MKRIIAVVLVLAMGLMLLAACTESKDKKETEPSTEGPTTNYFWPENLGDATYEGYEFKILNWGDTGGDHWSAYEFIYDQGMQGDVINDAVFERDSLFEEKFKVDLTYIVKDKATIGTFAENSILAGGNDFDVLSIGLTTASRLALDGLLLDLYDYKDILNLDEDWWDKSANDQISFANHLFFTNSDLTLVDKQATWVVFFTKSMIGKYNLIPDYNNDLYAMVDDGAWTIEAMYNMVKTVSDDADGDGEMTDQDIYGHAGEGFNLAALMVGCESRITGKDENDLPYFMWTENSDQHVESARMANEIVNNSDYSMLSGRMQGYTGGEDVWQALGGLMSTERLLFNVTGMNRCRLYRDLECEFGIVPVPKANRQQSQYYSLMSMGQANSIAIPLTCSDPERTCVLLEGLTCLASQTTYKAYIDKALTYKYLRDEESADMLDIIFNGRMYDSCDVYSLGVGNSSVFGSKITASTIVSKMESMRNVTETMIKKKTEEFNKKYKG